MTDAEKAAADKLAADKKEADRLAADQAAQAKAWSEQPLIVAGDAKMGGPFSIDGDGFGMQGSLVIADREIKTTRWTDRSIKGVLPAGLSGDVVLTTAKGTRHGKWPYVRPVVTKTTTVTVETK